MIKHILKDGTVLQDITGHIIKQESAQVVYQIIEQMEREGKNERNHIRTNQGGK